MGNMNTLPIARTDNFQLLERGDLSSATDLTPPQAGAARRIAKALGLVVGGGLLGAFVTWLVVRSGGTHTGLASPSSDLAKRCQNAGWISDLRLLLDTTSPTQPHPEIEKLLRITTAQQSEIDAHRQRALEALSRFMPSSPKDDGDPARLRETIETQLRFSADAMVMKSTAGPMATGVGKKLRSDAAHDVGLALFGTGLDCKPGWTMSEQHSVEGAVNRYLDDVLSASRRDKPLPISVQALAPPMRKEVETLIQTAVICEKGEDETDYRPRVIAKSLDGPAHAPHVGETDDHFEEIDEDPDSADMSIRRHPLDGPHGCLDELDAAHAQEAPAILEKLCLDYFGKALERINQGQHPERGDVQGATRMKNTLIENLGESARPWASRAARVFVHGAEWRLVKYWKQLLAENARLLNS